MMILRDFLKICKYGFTLIELLIVVAIIGVLAAGATLVVTNIMQRGRFDTTVKRMEDIKFAIIGNPALITNNVRTDFGYNGDMGRLPGATVPVLDELVNQGAQPAWNSLTQCGWHGPYIRSGFQQDPDQFRRDGWGNSFSYNNTTGVITSLGSDGAIGGAGWAADINSEVLYNPPTINLITNSVAVKVFDGKGNPATGATITVYYPSSGIETNTSYVLLPVDGGMHTFLSIPTGSRKIVVVFSGETYTKWVAVVPTTTVSADYKIIKSPTTPNPATGLTATPLSTTQIRLSWTAPTLNTDGSALTDLVSYNIYRGITTGTETFLINTGNTNVSYTDTGLTESQVYYYQISAINSGGNESARSTEASAIASPIRQRAAPIPLLGGSTVTQWRIPIQNYGLNTITISSMQITWTGSVTRYLRTIEIGPSGTYTTVWSTTLDTITSPTSVLNFSPTYNLTTAATTIEVRLTFDGNIRVDTLTLRFNTSDGYVIVVNSL